MSLNEDREFISSINREMRSLSQKYELPKEVTELFEKVNGYIENEVYLSIYYMHECHLFTNLINDLDSKSKLKNKLKLLCEDSGYHGAAGLTLEYRGKREKSLAFIHGRGEANFEKFVDDVWAAVEQARQEHGEEVFIAGKLTYEQRRKQRAEKTT